MQAGGKQAARSQIEFCDRLLFQNKRASGFPDGERIRVIDATAVIH